jgi:hypothetical protein
MNEEITLKIEIEILRQEVSKASRPSVVNTESRLMVDAPGSSDLAPLAS